MKLLEPSSDALTAHLRRRNTQHLGVGSWATLVAFMGFAVLDSITFTEALWEVWFVRVCCVAVLAFIFVAHRIAPLWTETWIHPISLGVTFVCAAGIAVMTWLHSGYESPYYAGICLVLLAAGFLFTWSRRRTYVLYAAVYATYMAPFALRLIEVHDWRLVVSNQFFLLGTIALSVLIQVSRYDRECEELRMKATLEEMATTDELTRLNNRRRFFELAQYELGRAQRYGRDLTAIMVDIDHFKAINDAYGHLVGDDVLRAVANHLAGSVRSQDIIGRYGGEEFAIVTPETGLEAATENVAKRLCESLALTPILTSAGPIRVTVSVGVATYTSSMKDISILLDKADEALYLAKRRGRNLVVSVA